MKRRALIAAGCGAAVLALASLQGEMHESSAIYTDSKSAGSTFTASAFAPATTDTIFDSSHIPATAANSDTGAVTLGVKIRPKVNAEVTQIKFYKGTGNTGTHVGKLWTISGVELGSVTFTGETATGWQTATLATPVAVKAWQVYIVGVYMPVGRYATDSGLFASSGRDRTLLVAPQAVTAGVNGLYHYAAAATFPYRTSGSTSYGIDATLQTTSTPRSGRFLQQASGRSATSATTASVTLPEATTAGNTLLLAYVSSSTVNTPAGWTLDKSQVNITGTYLFRKTAGAGETSWTITNTSSAVSSWWVAEVTGVTAAPLDGAVSVGSGSLAGTYATPNLTPTSGNRLLIALLGSMDPSTAGTTPPSDSYAWTNSFAKTGEAVATVTTEHAGTHVATREVTANGSTAYSTGAAWIDNVHGTAILAAYKLS